eukprot:Protomagalhaensia_wolfi_Nauph_80__4796@NODE_4_length_7346_cov_85_118106_g2_i0_p5_GENE_NODE_4_length_7346_cov_85_118106_g2_i0NODE_4_length_7346_cov_85_118106_g2_i0_p5_ORF_typecomplete_len190_score22_62IMUP/PF15761_5/0_36_NODE_4_length_7346_cov_85_118106_g2_i047515320
MPPTHEGKNARNRKTATVPPVTRVKFQPARHSDSQKNGKCDTAARSLSVSSSSSSDLGPTEKMLATAKQRQASRAQQSLARSSAEGRNVEPMPVGPSTRATIEEMGEQGQLEHAAKRRRVHKVNAVEAHIARLDEAKQSGSFPYLGIGESLIGRSNQNPLPTNAAIEEHGPHRKAPIKEVAKTDESRHE